MYALNTILFYKMEMDLDLDKSCGVEPEGMTIISAATFCRNTRY
jgi:hypothetical protein